MKTVEILPKRKKRDLLSATGETLRGVRKERGLTLRQVAEGAHVSVSYLAEIERGEKDPSSRILESIAGGLDIEMSGLLIRIAEALEPALPASWRLSTSAGQPVTLAAIPWSDVARRRLSSSDHIACADLVEGRLARW